MYFNSSAVIFVSYVIVSSTLSQCSVGFITCKDGRCEPFESLCGAAGNCFYTPPQKVARYYVIPSEPFECPSVRPSVRPSVSASFPD